MKIIELETGVYLAGGNNGDPPRTLMVEHAKEFKAMSEAVWALRKARKSRPFKSAQIHESLF